MKKNGSVLIISLWILAILVIFALGLGHRASINLRLANYQKNGLKAYYLAKAGINRAIIELDNDQTPNYDYLEDNWANNEAVFKSIAFGDSNEEYARVGYLLTDETSGKQDFIYGLIDEERKININKIDEQGQRQLHELLLYAKLNNEEAQDLKNIAVEWINSVAEPEEEKKVFKNAELKSGEELLLILEWFYKNKGISDHRKKSQDIYNALKDMITVYSDNKMNINTSSRPALIILANSLTENEGQRSAVPNVIDAILTLRASKKFFASLDEISINAASGSVEEQVLNALKGYLKINSQFFCLKSTGNVRQISKVITLVYDRGGKAVTYWHEN